MGISMSTLAGWVVIGCIAGYYTSRYFNTSRPKLVGKATTHGPKLEEKPQARKDGRDKAKRQRGEAYSKDTEESDKSAKAKPRAAKVSAAPAQPAADSSDDDMNNREFARQLASVKQGTSLNGPKKSDEKRAKSVKQSRAREMDMPNEAIVSGPSSTAGADGDDDESSVASSKVQARDAGDVSDMLEPKAAGPSVLRLTDTDKVKPKEKKAKSPEKTESKKQRQNRQKAEAAKNLREDVEKERKAMMEAQRRLARISEGRPAKDGSGFMASQTKHNAWIGNGVNGKPDEGNLANGNFLPVQPLDTFDGAVPANAPAEASEAEVPKVGVPKSTPPSAAKEDSWISTLPSEEEQMEMLREEEAWSTVKTKKSGKTKNKGAATDVNKEVPESAVTQPQQVAPVTNPPVAADVQKTASTNGRPTKTFTQQSSFAALSTDDVEPEVEEEWDV